ncbi:MAG: stage II sporulation protein M [Bacteroidota bacterium]
MKEITFLKQNSSKWEEYEILLDKGEVKHPAKVTEIFIEITDDFSYAKSNYQGSKSVTYLNGLASRIHQLVYKNKKESNKKILSFWKTEVPTLFGKYHNLLLVSFVLAIIGTLLGAASQLYDDTFVRIIMGDEYVNQTIERIKKGNPLGIYGEAPEGFMYFYITINNIRVSFVMFAMGMLFSLGTGFYLLYNCIMLGSFLAMFHQYNVLGKALKVVWIHGTLEISAIVIAGCAGFVLGNSFMFPGTYSRLESFKRGSKDGIKIVIGLIPVFMCAGFLESFITRYTEMPLWLSLIIIFGSLTFLIWYFIWLPLKLKNNNHYATTKN